MSRHDLRTLLPVLCCLTPLAGVVQSPRPAAAEDFRIDNKVYVEGRKEAVGSSTTVFREGVLFDFMQLPEEITIFDEAGRRFVLLNVRRKLRAELPLAAVIDFADRLKQRAEKSDEPLVKFQASPEFEEEFDPSTGELTLSSPWMTYRVKTRNAENRELAGEYRKVSDWLARLNAVLNPGSRLPAPRLLVNEALAKRDLTAREVQLMTTVTKGLTSKKTIVRSEHHVSRRLTDADLARVKHAQQYAADFRPVGFDEYRKADGR